MASSMGKRSRTEEQRLFQEIQKGNERTLHELYESYRSPFIGYLIKTYQCSEDRAVQVYQKAFTVFYFNIKDGKVQELTSTLKTYLFGIGKRVMFEFFREDAKSSASLDDAPEVQVLDLSYLSQESADHREKVVKTLLGQLGDKCREILKLYYFQRFSMESIADELGYKNDKVAKKKKYECLQKLRSMMESTDYTADELLNT
ncbi:MAG: sigma-70 family RNA polymerase sigma factor [Bacteroidota bacterium]